MQIDKIKDVFKVRTLNEKYVDFLVDDFQNNGFQSAYPVSVTDDGILWDGNHRYAAAVKLGLKEIPHIIETPDNIRKAAHERNSAAANALPETFVDHAQEIWDMIDGGMTQMAVADEIGWSRDKVARYSALKKINSSVWDKIVTTIGNIVTSKENEAVTKFVTVVTENMLRSILHLNPTHQDKIVDSIIDGSLKNTQVKKKAQLYRDRENFLEYALDNLKCDDDKIQFGKDIISGLYSTSKQVEKAVEQANDIFDEKNQIQVIQGDCLTELKNIDDESFDLLLTDPPYFILDDEWDKFKNKDHFLSFSREWIKLATSKVKTTGRIYICWSQVFMFDFPFDALSDDFIFGNVLIWNYKNNIKPHNQKIYKHTYEPIFYFYGQDADKLNLPNSESWDESINNLDHFTIAQPQSNFKNDQKLHPAQKPLELFKQLMCIGSDIGDKVMDCFAGSGTTGVAAKELKRKAVLIEENTDYLKIINRRLNE